jgi:hypothetical protein
MTTIGAGVIILIIIWSASVLFLLAFCQAQGTIRALAVVPAVFSAIITIVLTSIPRGPANKTSLPDYMYSNISLIWIFIFISLILALLVCLIIYLITDIMEPHFANVSKTFKQSH